MVKASLQQLTRNTHKGRKSRTKMNAHSEKAGMGVRATNLRANPREISAVMTRITPTPSGPEPGHGGTTF